MSNPNDLHPQNQQPAPLEINQYLEQQQDKSLLRLLTCGSVDDGKSTLIGRLLHDAHQLYEDQLSTLQEESNQQGNHDQPLDFALLVDGLQAEREQGITIDVAYRYFSTQNRKFIIADTPGHEQYTRNMATGASNCQLAIILIDARYGVQVQTKRHSYICDRLGIQQFVIAINKMDLVDYQANVFQQIQQNYLAFAENLTIDKQHIRFIPIAALHGDNVVDRSDTMNWYQGKPLLDTLENAPQQVAKITEARFPVQYVNRPDLNFRGFCGTVSGDKLHQGMAIKVLPSGSTARISSIVDFAGEHPQATVGQATTLTLDREIDISRGDVIVPATSEMTVANQLQATLVWMSTEALQLDKEYLIKLGHKTTTATVTTILHQVNINTLEQLTEDPNGGSLQQLELNAIGSCQLQLTEAVALDRYQDNQLTGSFIVIDRFTNITIAAGLIEQPLTTSGVNTISQSSEFERELNALIRKHFPHWQALEIK